MSVSLMEAVFELQLLPGVDSTSWYLSAAVDMFLPHIRTFWIIFSKIA